MAKAAVVVGVASLEVVAAVAAPIEAAADTLTALARLMGMESRTRRLLRLSMGPCRLRQSWMRRVVDVDVDVVGGDGATGRGSEGGVVEGVVRRDKARRQLRTASCPGLLRPCA